MPTPSHLLFGGPGPHQRAEPGYERRGIEPAIRERTSRFATGQVTYCSGGLLILQGYTPKQLEYATGGPKQIQNLYTREMLEEAFSDFDDLRIVEEEREIYEGTSHLGMSALIGLTGRKPKRPEH